MYLAANINSQKGHLTFKAELDMVVSIVSLLQLLLPPLTIGGAGVGGLGLFISNWTGDGVAEEPPPLVFASLCT